MQKLRLHTEVCGVLTIFTASDRLRDGSRCGTYNCIWWCHFTGPTNPPWDKGWTTVLQSQKYFYGVWDQVILGLEIELAADILRSAINPINKTAPSSLMKTD